MPMQTCTAGTLRCSFGAAPSTFVATPRPVMTANVPAGNILDHQPLVNIQPFGVCMSLANPSVAAATSAALGVLTPMPCVPNTPAPWIAGAPNVLICNAPALDNVSTLMCAWGGVITFVSPGQFTHHIP
ncbi:DUF4280 domain-containing protein [Ramlibacter sp. AW1]|uniref:DUF4280 domain-containing protein n=1 Tax=Ramlibacter aurantiacus TaxID=2801330 RepID=A0A936ZL03_9BURK|nr:DUF4280 domain-containing protein [Ramlibacter aurantiacus]MBL0419626.1 DUF4280 domain-containing protein [Ramlibacter aurantiacus]